MRYPAGHKQSTHERILAAGGALLRSAGVEGASVGRVMSRAGLTVGGFYAHFASKRALVGEALRWVLRRKRSDWLRDLEALRGPAFLEAFVRRYLSRQHRDLAGQGCPLPAVLSDLPRAGAPARRALEAELELLCRALEPHAQGESGSLAVSARQRALATLALCFGGMALARAVQDRALSDEILLACRRFALAPDAARSASERDPLN
jgi:TetR/AcrR family transcriptional repressor of nem operon